MDAEPDAEPDKGSAPEKKPVKEPDKHAPTDLAGLLAGLQREQDTLTDTIKTAKAALTGQEDRQESLKREITKVTRSIGDLEREDADAAALLAEVEQAVAGAQPLIDQLDDDVRDTVDNDIAGLDTAIKTAWGQVTTARDQHAEQQTAHDEAVRAVAARQAEFDAASAALAGLPAAIKATTAALRKLTKDLVSATKAGLDRKAYVLKSEVTATSKELAKLRGDEHEKKLVGDVQSAMKALVEAKSAAAAAVAELTARDERLRSRTAEHAALVAARPAKIEKLYALSRDTAPAVPAARGA